MAENVILQVGKILKGQYRHSQSFQQGMESVSKFNKVTENYWLIYYAAATVIWPYHVGYYFQSLS